MCICEWTRWSDWLHLSCPPGSIKWPEGTGYSYLFTSHSNCVNQQVASWNHIRYQFPDTDKIHRYTNTQPCCFRPKGLSALGKDRVYFLPVTAKVLFSLCICVCSMRLSSTTGCIAMASRAEENCPIQAQRTHQYGNQFIGAILIWQDVCRNHHPLLWQTSLIHGHNSPCVVQSDPKISFPVIFFLWGMKLRSTA